jgi:CspA family cold shock protein
MFTGTVKWYNETKGYGFVINEDQKEVFVHRSGLKSNTLIPGQKVNFGIKEGQKGPVAIDVEVIG